MSLMRCPNGHMFSTRKYGTTCPYCNMETAAMEDAKDRLRNRGTKTAGTEPANQQPSIDMP